MKKYLCETHSHTSEVSPCSSLSAKQQVELYKKAGYSTIIITDHFSNPVLDDRMPNASWEEKVEYFLNGYKLTKKEAKGEINVLLGMELRFPGSDNDYLIYGLTEEFVRKNNTAEFNFVNMDVKSFSEFARKNGLLMYQAHPFRNNMYVVNPKFLDGIEVRNCNPNHDSRNDIAMMWAEKFGLKKTSGSDVHEVEAVGKGGIYTNEPITSQEQLMEILRSENYELKTE